MKLIGIIVKGMKEQVRSFWVLFLSLSMGPFFILVYFLITESSKPHYTVLVVNADKGLSVHGQSIDYGDSLVSFFTSTRIDIQSAPFVIQQITDRRNGMEELKNKRADALIIIPESFSQSLGTGVISDSLISSEIEFIGDLTDIKYLISAVWAGEIINEYTHHVTNQKRIIEVRETALGTSGSISEFNMLVPGILIVSIIMLMFTASIAFVSEIENKTILRLKLSKLSAMEFIGGIGIVQLLVGLASVVLSLATAILLGFQYAGSLTIMLFIASLTSLSIISFSLIIAAVTKSANEVLVVGNFPMFLFMFFTGAAFPLKSKALFTIAGYPMTLQGLMTPTHAISALNKTLILNLDFISIVPEIIAMIVLSIVYLYIGAILFKVRHLKLT